MSPDNFNKDFAKEFNQVGSLYSATEEFRQGSLLFIQFGGTPQEINSLAAAVAKKLYQSGLVNQLTCRLNKECIPQIGYICTSVSNIIDEFNSYINNEPCTAHYYNGLIAILNSFQQLVSELNKDIYGQVSNKLNEIHTGVHDPKTYIDLNSSYLSEAIDFTEFYLKNLLAYYNHFIIVLHQENENGKGIGLTTQVADHLLELTSIIEAVSATMEDVLSMLLTWEVQMEMQEDQALYN